MRLVDLDQLNMGYSVPDDVDEDSYDQGVLMILDRLLALKPIADDQQRNSKKERMMFLIEKGIKKCNNVELSEMAYKFIGCHLCPKEVKDSCDKAIGDPYGCMDAWMKFLGEDMPYEFDAYGERKDGRRC